MPRRTVMKIIVNGESGVGKTSLCHRFLGHGFIEEHKATIGADFLTKEITINDNHELALQIWDTAGQERFESISNFFYRGASCCVIVYDITNYKTFSAIDKWKKKFADYADDSSVPCILVANKYDLIDKCKFTKI